MTAASIRCANCGGPRSPGSIVKTPGHESWCTWCESIDQVKTAQDEAFQYHDRSLAQQRAQAATTYRRSGEINPVWIATIVVFVFLAIMRVACR